MLKLNQCKGKQRLARVGQFFAVVIILVASIIVAMILTLYKVEPEKVKLVARPTLVDVIAIQPTDEQAIVTAFGAVEGDRVLTVMPQVTGRIIEMSPNFVKGGILQEGEVILKIEPTDFEIRVQQEKAALEKADFELKVEKGKGIVAEREWQLFENQEITSMLGRELALRRPHLREKEAAFLAAKSSLDRALLDLKRTIIKAPFDSIVIEEFVEFDQLISPSTKVATLVATDQFRVQVSIPYDRLQWIDLDEEDSTNAKVILEAREDLKVERDAYVQRLLGDLDPNGRMVRILLGIKDPMGLENKEFRNQPMLIGSYVRVEIDGPFLENVYILPRHALREGDKLWIKNNENELEIREVDIVMKRPETILIKESLSPGEEVVMSPIALPLPGMALETSKVLDLNKQ